MSSTRRLALGTAAALVLALVTALPATAEDDPVPLLRALLDARRAATERLLVPLVERAEAAPDAERTDGELYLALRAAQLASVPVRDAAGRLHGAGVMEVRGGDMARRAAAEEAAEVFTGLRSLFQRAFTARPGLAVGDVADAAGRLDQDVHQVATVALSLRTRMAAQAALPADASLDLIWATDEAAMWAATVQAMEHRIGELKAGPWYPDHGRTAWELRGAVRFLRQARLRLFEVQRELELAGGPAAPATYLPVPAVPAPPARRVRPPVPVPDLPPIAERIELARDRMFQAGVAYERARTSAGVNEERPEHAVELARRAATAHEAATALFRLVEAARPAELRPRERSDHWIDAAIGVEHTDYTRRHWEAVVAQLGVPADDLQPDDERAKHVVRFRRDAQRNLAVATAESASTADHIRLLEQTAANPEHPASEAARAALFRVRDNARLDAIRLREARDDLDKWEGRYAELLTAANPAGNLAATATPPVAASGDGDGRPSTRPVPVSRPRHPRTGAAPSRRRSPSPSSPCGSPSARSR
jgi:hypothetical protein